MRGWVAILALVGLMAGCGGLGEGLGGSAEDETGGAVGEGIARDAETIELGGALSSVAFGEGSLWITDLGGYACDDTPGGPSSDQTSSASCVEPDEVLLKRVDPETLEVIAAIPLRSPHVKTAFGAGSVWVLSSDRASPSGPSGKVLRIDPEKDRIVGEITTGDSSSIAFGEGSLWVTGSRDGTVSRVDPDTGETVAEIEVSTGGVVSGLAVDERSGTVWVANTGSGPPETFVPPEDYERGFRSTPAEDAKLVRVDAATNRVVAEIPIEATTIEGGARDAAVGGDAVWATSVNGRLIRVDPATNEAVIELPLGDYSFDVEVSEETVWATSEANVRDRDSFTHRLTRVDTATNHVVGSVDIDNLSGLALGAGAAWVTTGNVETGEGTLVRYTL